MRERFPEHADRIHRIYNGLNLAEFGHANVFSDPPLIVAIGRLIPKKGFANLIRACGLLVEHRISFRCEIFGEGPLENQLRAQIEDLGLKERVQLLGAKPQHQLREHLARANVFVMPSVAGSRGWHGQFADSNHGSDGRRLAGCFNQDRRDSGDGR